MRVLRGLRAVPGVESAALAFSVPLDIHGLPSRSFALEGRADTGTPDEALSNIVTSGYLATMGIPLVAGTDFADLDDAAAPPQAIVNQAFVARYAPDGTVIGRRLVSRGVAHVIVGVARTSTYDAFGEAPTPLVLYSYRDRPLAAAEMHLRTRPGTELAMASAIRRVVADLDPSLPVFDVRTLPEHIARNLVLRRMPARMFLVLGPLLLLLAAIGVYAVVDYGVSQRTSEIAVRLALGATSQAVVRRIVAETLAVIGLGVGASTLLAVAVDLHLVRGGLRDVPVLVGVPLLLVCSRSRGGVAAGQAREPRAAGERPPRDLAGLALPCAAVTILREHSISRIYLSACRMRFGSSRPRSSRRWPTPPASPSSRRCATASCPLASCSNCSRSSRRTCPSTSRCCDPSRSW